MVRLLEVAGVDPGPVEAVRRLILATTKEGGSGTKRQVAAAAAGGRPAPRGAGAGGHPLPASEETDDDDDDDEVVEGEEEEGDGEGSLGDAAGSGGAMATSPAAAPGAEAATVAAVEPPPARAGGGTDIIIGMVGHPNVGKSSVINTVCAAKRVSVSRTAGHTKRAQTIPVVPGVQLLDCPGLVFPRALVPRPTAAPPVAAAAAASAPQAAVEAQGAEAPMAAVASSSAESAEGPSAVQTPPPHELGARPVVMPRVMTADERAAAAYVRRIGAAPSAAAAAMHDATAPLPAYLSHGAATAATTGEAVERAMQQLCGVISLAQVSRSSASGRAALSHNAPPPPTPTPTHLRPLCAGA